MDFAKPTYLYISATLYALGAMLRQKDDETKERAIYYLSKTLIDYETRYTPMKKFCFGIFFATKKLRHYLLYCTTYVVSPVNPLKYLVAKHHLSRRVAKWLMLLQEFDINVVKQKSMKGQASADLIAEFPRNDGTVVHKEFPNEYDEDSRSQRCATLMGGRQRHDIDETTILDEFVCYMEDEPIAWTLYFDGSKSSYRAGARIVLVSPTNEVIPMAYKLGFECTNNMAKYEALILGLKATITLKIKDLEIYCNDSNKISSKYQLL